MYSYPESLNASSGNLLAVIQFYPFQAVAALEVFQGGICDQGAVVQLNDLQAIMRAGTIA